MFNLPDQWSINLSWIILILGILKCENFIKTDLYSKKLIDGWWLVSGWFSRKTVGGFMDGDQKSVCWSKYIVGGSMVDSLSVKGKDIRNVGGR